MLSGKLERLRVEQFDPVWTGLQAALAHHSSVILVFILGRGSGEGEYRSPVPELNWEFFNMRASVLSNPALFSEAPPP